MATISLQSLEATLDSAIVEKLVNISLSEEDYQAITASKHEFNDVVQYLVEQFAKGGVMIPVDDVGYLADLSQMPVASSSDIIGIVDSALRRHSPNGMLRVTTDVDPAFAPGLEELARMQGRTIDEIVNEALNIIFSNNWLFGMSLADSTIPFLAEQRSRLERIIKKAPLTSDILVSWIEEKASESRRLEREPKEKDKELVQVAATTPETPPAERPMSKLRKLVVEKLEGVTR